ncbi:MAG TPA: hypothetical protein VMW25_03390 [Clostridia bacterium]|nr:hypothetical protein [Clostridia bacterium]
MDESKEFFSLILGKRQEKMGVQVEKYSKELGAVDIAMALEKIIGDEETRCLGRGTETNDFANHCKNIAFYKKLQARVEKLEKALNKIAVGDDESDPYGYIPRDEFRDIAKQALKGGE